MAEMAHKLHRSLRRRKENGRIQMKRSKGIGYADDIVLNCHIGSQDQRARDAVTQSRKLLRRYEDKRIKDLKS